MVMNLLEDRKCAQAGVQTKVVGEALLSQLVKSFGLQDLGKHLTMPTKSILTTQMHRSWSRIDCFFLPQ